MEYITHEGYNLVRITLYGRYYFNGISSKYINIYKDESFGKSACRLVKCDNIDTDADIVFEKAINPAWESGTYVCIKCFDKYRSNIYDN